MQKKVLFLNIGTATKGQNHGNEDEEYYASFKTAISDANCKHIVLISSVKSRDKAERLKTMYPEDYRFFDIHLNEDDEYDTGKCFKTIYKGFESLNEVIDISNDSIVDTTHATGPMQSALLAAALYHDVLHIQYLKRKGRPGAWEGEEILHMDTSYPRMQSVFKQCRELFKSWQFSAAKSLFSAVNGIRINIDNVKTLADFYSAWDRLDYNAAFRICFAPENTPAFSETLPEDIESFGFAATDAVREWIKALAKPVVEPDERKNVLLSTEQINDNAGTVLNIMFDLYANGLRRLEAQQYEDAGIRAYRIAEMMGQYYLFKEGYISNHMYFSNAEVRAFAENNGISPQNGSDLLRPFGRKQVISFLRHIHHPEADFLESLEADIERRNTSILIHGYSSSIDDVENLRNVFESLRRKLEKEVGEEGKEKLGAALFMNNFKDRNR